MIFTLIVQPLGRAQAGLSQRFNETGNAAWLLLYVPVRMLFLPFAHAYLGYHRLRRRAIRRRGL